MRDTGTAWKTYINNNQWSFIASLKIGDTEYASISAPKITRQGMPSAFSVGNCLSASLEVSILTDDDIADGAAVEVLGKLTEDNVTFSDQMTFGTFYVNTRSTDYSTGLITLQCYDAMLMASATFKTTGGTMTQAEAAAEIAEAIGCGLDSRNAIKSAYTITYTSSDTGTTILQKIAACHGANWIITEENNLRLVPLSYTGDAVNVPAVMGTLSTGSSSAIYALTNGSDTVTSSTLSDGATVDLSTYADDISDEILTEIGETLLDSVYQAYTATNAMYDPAAEIGDVVTIGDLTGVLWNTTMTLNIAFRADLSAPDEETIASEYPYESSLETAVAAAVAAAESAEETAAEALETASTAKTLTVSLSAESLTVPVDSDGDYDSFPSISVVIQALYGTDDVTDDCTITVVEENVTGTLSGNLYTPSALSADTGTVTFEITYGSLTVTKVFTITKLYGVSSLTIASSEVTYQASDSGTTTPTGTWLTSVPSVSQGQYLWTRTTVTYSDSTTTTSYSVAYIGSDGDSVSISSTAVTYQASDSGTTTPTGTWLTSVPSVSQGQYLWTRTVVTYSDGTSTTAYSVSYIGADGSSVSVASTSITYASSSSGTETPSTWSTSVPTVSQGDYLWTRTIVTYTDATTTTSYSVAYNAVDGEDADALTITAKAVTYQLSSSGTTTPTGTWSSSVPTLTQGKYLWTRTVVTYSDSTSVTSYSVAYIAVDGDAGNGISSITNYYLVTASSVGVTTSTSGWTTAVQTPTSTKPYLWNYELISYTLADDETTEPAIIGMYAEDGVSVSSVTEEYALSTSSSSVTGTWSTDIPTMTATNKYLWNRETVNFSDGTSSTTDAVVIGVYGDTGDDGADGSDGIGISSITEYYARSTSNSTAPTSWSTSVPTLTSTYKYLWNYETVTYTDNTTTSTTAAVIGVYGDTGDAGEDGTSISISSTTVRYVASSSGTTTPTSGWSSTIPTVSQGNYLWTRTIVTYSDGTTTTSYSVAYIATDGADGEDGADGTSVSISSTAITYQLSSSGTTTPTGTWSSSVPTLSQGYFLWTRTVVTYSDSTTTTAYSVSYIANDGDDGSDGEDGATLYATCSTAASTTTKAATITPTNSSFALSTGVTINITFTYKNTASSPKLNVNSTGAKSIYAFGSALAAVYYWSAGSTVQFVYNGSQWVMTDNSAMTIAANWCYENDTTYIDGANIYAGTLAANSIVAGDTLTNALTATNLTVTGESTFEGTITGSTITGSDFYTSGTSSSGTVSADDRWAHLYNGTIEFGHFDDDVETTDGYITGADGGEIGIIGETALAIECPEIRIRTASSFDDGCGFSISDDGINGYGALTLYNNITVSKSTGASIFYAKRTDTSTTVSMQVGSGGYNRGIYDDTDGEWMLYKDSDGYVRLGTSGDTVYIGGYARYTGTTSIYTAGYLSTSNTHVYFHIPYISYGASPTLTINGLTVRQEASYLFGGSSATAEPSSVSYTYRRSGFFDVNVTLSSSSVGGTNNAPVGIYCSFTVS